MASVIDPDRAQLQSWCDLAVAIANDAGAVLLECFGRDLVVETKSNRIDLVTEADRAAEAVILDRLRTLLPDHGILAEESGLSREHAPLRWMVDPLDGTTNFAHGFPHFSVSMSLYAATRGLVGVVHDPTRAETFCAFEGGGAWLRRPGREPSRLRVTSTTALEQSLLATGFAYDRATATTNNVDEFVRLLGRVHGIRRPGSAALDLAWVAGGRLDGYWEFHLSPWDWAAGTVLVREAGGEVVTVEGAPWAPGCDSLVAANPRLLPHLRKALRP